MLLWTWSRTRRLRQVRFSHGYALDEMPVRRSLAHELTRRVLASAQTVRWQQGVAWFTVFHSHRTHVDTLITCHQLGVRSQHGLIVSCS